MTGAMEDVAFTQSIKTEQVRRGSRDERGRTAFAPLRTDVTPLAAFLANIDTAYLATASADGQPYAQHRGGSKGFIKIIDAGTVGFADFDGNKQYITIGNLAENSRAFLFLMDYAARRRIKLWGTARMVEDPHTVAMLQDAAYPAAAERALLFSVEVWDVNCPRHIPQKIDLEVASASMQQALAERDARIAVLEQELAELRARDTVGRF